MDERELNFQRAIFTLQKRLFRSGRIHRNQMRYSCMWATDDDFQRLLDVIVAGGIATRETGKRGGEWYRSAMGVTRD
jgi:hypothetical protein